MKMSRRQALKRTALFAAAISSASDALSQFFTDRDLRALYEGERPFQLPPLLYGVDALEPHVDTRTMEIHHDKHHAAYVKNLNLAMAQDFPFYKEWVVANNTAPQKKTVENWLEELLRDLNAVPEAIRTSVRNNGGGHYNHSLFWQMMKKNGGGEPKGELAAALDRSFGSFNSFKDIFTKAALGQFGSGWAWLSIDGPALKIEATPNQDSPLSAGRPVLLGLDVWEHAYYLKYQNKRPDYIAAWWNVVNWDFVAERYLKLKA
jgi:superoxide dismutase, Fe-Mn family